MHLRPWSLPELRRLGARLCLPAAQSHGPAAKAEDAFEIEYFDGARDDIEAAETATAADPGKFNIVSFYRLSPYSNSCLFCASRPTPPLDPAFSLPQYDFSLPDPGFLFDADPISLTANGSHPPPLLEIILTSSKILFRLCQLSDRLFSKDPACSSSHEWLLPKILKHVSTFCEIQATDDLRMQRQLENETQSMVQLALMIIASVLKIYSSLVQNSDTMLSAPVVGLVEEQPARPLTPSTISSPSTSSGFFQTPSFQRRLAILLHLTVMDYHLAQFQCILSHFSSTLGHQQMFAKEVEKNSSDAAALRAQIQLVAEGLKVTYLE